MEMKAFYFLFSHNEQANSLYKVNEKDYGCASYDLYPTVSISNMVMLAIVLSLFGFTPYELDFSTSGGCLS